MQDGDATPADEAGEWLRKTLKDQPERRSELLINNKPMDPESRARLLEILFGPLP